MNLVKNIGAFQHISQTTAGITDQTGANVIDTAGFEGVLFVGILDTITAAGTIRMYPRHSDSTGTGDQVACTGSAYIAGTTATTTDMETQLILLDVYKPLKRYVSVYVDKATQNTEIKVLALPYGARVSPVAQSSGQYGVVDSVVAISPTT